MCNLNFFADIDWCLSTWRHVCLLFPTPRSFDSPPRLYSSSLIELWVESRWNPFQFPPVLTIVVACDSHSFHFQPIYSPFLPLVALVLQSLHHWDAPLQFVSRNKDPGAADERRVNWAQRARMQQAAWCAFEHHISLMVWGASCHSHLKISSYSACLGSLSDNDIEMHAPVWSVLLTV